MNPINDVVCNLIQTPFSHWKDDDKKDLLQCGRPTHLLSVQVRKDVKKTGKSYNINFKNSWFADYKWLCSSLNLQKLFCWPCLLFSSKNTVWAKEGFADFININRSLHKHQDSAQHLKCKLQLKIFEKNRNTIADALKENASLMKVQFNEKVRLNRLVMKLVIDAVLYLGKQELGFRGHDESSSSLNRGNFKELLSLLITTSTLEIQTHYTKIKSVFSGDSKSIQNEVIECISEYMQDQIKSEIENTFCFSIQVDDTTDITQTSQCSVIIRCVNSEAKLVERFLGFHDVSSSRTSEKLFSLIDNLLKEFDYERKLVAQCYDGASVMSGHLNGLQKIVKDKAPQAVFVHCLAHRLNLVLQQSCEQISKCRIFFSNVVGFPSFFHHSAKRTHAIDSNSARRLPTAVTTRWSSNSNILRVIIEDWNNLKNVFEILMMDKEADKKTVQLASGFLHHMNSFEFTFLAVVFNDIFNLTDLLFGILQKKSLDINYCLLKINSTREIIQGKRNEKCFQEIFEKANKLNPVSQNRKRYENHCTDEEISQNYRTLFYEILDTVLMQMKIRFQDCEKLHFLKLVDTAKFESYVTDFPNDALANLEKSFPKVFKKIQRLKNELCLLYADETYRYITIEKLLSLIHENRDVFEEAYKLFSIALTIPSTSASVERSFSCLKRIKTYTRNQISQERLSSLANMSIQREFLQDLLKTRPFYEDIINKFAALKDRRIDLIYKN